MTAADALDKNFAHLTTRVKGGDLWPNGDYLRLEMYLREAELLEDLLEGCEQAQGLESILASRLHEVDRRLAQCASSVQNKGYYDENFWQTEHERQILLKILNDWWRWLRNTANPKRSRL